MPAISRASGNKSQRDKSQEQRRDESDKDGQSCLPFRTRAGKRRRPDLDYTGGRQKFCKISNLYMVNAAGLLAVMCPARPAMPFSFLASRKLERHQHLLAALMLRQRSG